MRRPLVTLVRLVVLLVVVLPPIAALRVRRSRPGPATFDPAEDEVDVAVVFAGADLRSEAAAFDGGEAEAWFGGLRLDLSAARLDPAGAILRVRCHWGGVEVIVPDDWGVEIHAHAIAGAVGDGTHPQAHPGPTLVVDAFALFGGIAIRGADEER